MAELRAANNLSENDVIKVGQVLIIPTADLNNAVSLNSKAVKTETKTESKATKTYVVQKGDTLYGIAKKSGMTVKMKKLKMHMNGLKHTVFKLKITAFF